MQKCFNPPLPPDLLLSFYISSAKLICAAYHMQQTTAAAACRQVFHVYQVRIGFMEVFYARANPLVLKIWQFAFVHS